MAKKNSPYQVQTWVDEGLSREEAEIKIKELKAKTAGTLDNFIRRHGPVEGPIRFQNFKDKSKHTLESFIKKYGEAGPEKFEEYKASKDSMSESYFKEKYGDDWQEYYERRKQSVKIDYNWAVRVHGDKADEVYKELLIKKTVKLQNSKPTQASKESLQYFDSTLKLLKEHNIPYNIGIKGESSELRLWCSDTKRLYYYDLAVPTLNLIVEYHGSHIHPKESDLDTNWKCALRKITAQEAWKQDEHKRLLALSKGYNNYICTYSEDYKKDKTGESTKLLILVRELAGIQENEDNKN